MDAAVAAAGGRLAGASRGPGGAPCVASASPSCCWRSLAVAVVLVRVLLGDYTVAFIDFVRIVRGDELPNAPGASFIVMEAKLPRALLGAARRGSVRGGGSDVPDDVAQPAGEPRHHRRQPRRGAAAVTALTFFDAQGIGCRGGALGALAVSLAHVRHRQGTAMAEPADGADRDRHRRAAGQRHPVRHDPHRDPGRPGCARVAHRQPQPGHLAGHRAAGGRDGPPRAAARRQPAPDASR